MTLEQIKAERIARRVAEREAREAPRRELTAEEKAIIAKRTAVFNEANRIMIEDGPRGLGRALDHIERNYR